MRIRFSAMHNPRSGGYTTYYSIVLVSVTATVFFMIFQVIHPSIIQGAGTFFEGFFSLFMLGRNDSVGKALLSHLSLFSAFMRR